MVHHLTHAQSVEYKSHVASVERERQAMSSLIEFKSHIVIPVGLKPGHQVGAGEARGAQDRVHVEHDHR